MTQDEGQRYAVVVGIDIYEDERIPNLEGAARDAQDVHDLLVHPDIGGFPRDNVRLLTNNAATLLNIKTYLGTELQNLVKRREDTVFIYFSGHGFGDYIVTHDSKKDNLIATALRMNQVRDIFKDIKSEKVIFLLDACFSGHAGGDSLPGVRTLPDVGAVSAKEIDDGLSDMAATGGGKMILTACGANELAWEDQGRGVFTRCLVEGVRTGAADVNGNEIIDIYDLSAYLQDQVRKDSGERQNPVSKGTVVRPFPVFKVYKPPPEKPPREVPILGFISPMGGTGKTTLVNRSADLLARTIPGTSILLIDMDFQTRQTTLLRTSGGAFNCRTMHDYIRDHIEKGGIQEFDRALDVTPSIGRGDDIARSNEAKEAYSGDSRIYLLPAADKAVDSYDTATKIKPSDLYRVVTSVIASAVERHDISYVLIDGEARLNFPFTAVAAYIADHLLLVGRPAPATWKGLSEYPAYIENFYPDFAPGKVHNVINQVKRGDQIPSDSVSIFAVIPHLIEYGDPFRDRINANLTRDVLLDRFILDVLKRALDLPEGDREGEVQAKEILDRRWRRLLELSPRLAERRSVKVYRRLTRPWPLAVMAVAVSTVLTLGLVVPLYWLRYRRRSAALRGLEDEKEEWVLKALLTPAGRDVLEDLSRWSE